MQIVSEPLSDILKYDTQRDFAMKHHTPPEFHTKPVYIELAGAGATGSLILAGLVRLHLAMLELGHPHGLRVRCWDPEPFLTPTSAGNSLWKARSVGTKQSRSLRGTIITSDWTGQPSRNASRRINIASAEISLSFPQWIPENHERKSV